MVLGQFSDMVCKYQKTGQGPKGYGSTANITCIIDIIIVFSICLFPIYEASTDVKQIILIAWPTGNFLMFYRFQELALPIDKYTLY